MTPEDIQPGQVFTREATQLRAVDTKTREFTAIGVPYGQRIETAMWREEFAPGSVTGSDRALILWAHRDHEVLGKVIAVEDTPEGHKITARLSDTERGREAYTLMQDGVIDRMSIGFQMRNYRVEEEEDGTSTVIHTEVRALEFSLVPFPAYEGAAITEVRRLHDSNTGKKEQVMAPEPITRDDVDSALEPVTDKLNLLERKLAQAVTTAGGPTSEVTELAQRFSSMGDFLKRAASGDEDALKLHTVLHRAPAAGATTAQAPAYAKNTFLGTQIKFVAERRRATNMFTRAALPAKGMNVEYAQLDTTTFLIGKQPAELDALPGPSLVTFKSATAPVETYGGWTRLSRQVIERVELPYLETVLTGMTVQYARTTEAAVLATVVNTYNAQVTATDTLTLGATVAAATLTHWSNAIVDAGVRFEGRGYAAAGLAMGSDVYKAVAGKLDADGRPLMQITGTPGINVNVPGSVDLIRSAGSLLGVPVYVLPGLAANRAFFFDPIAIEVRESAGAPVLLQDEDVIILGREFSLYGYMAVTVPFANALVPLLLTA